MQKNFKERIAFEVLMILGILGLLCLITRLWPLLFLVILGILVAALRLLFVSARKQEVVQITTAYPQEPLRPDTEQDVIRSAFGVLQRRISERIASNYPAARWVWDVPDAMQRFADDLPLMILLSQAGGFRRATVSVRNMQFCGLVYETADSYRPDKPPPDSDADGDYGAEDANNPAEPVDYALIAYQWVEAHLLELNNKCNIAIAANQTTLLIPACELPHPDSWQGVCDELLRNGFTQAEALEDGISLTIPE